MAGSDAPLNGDKRVVQRINFDLSSVRIKKLESVYSKETGKLLSVTFTLRNQKVEKFGNEPDPLPEGDTLERTSINIPPYEHIKSITYYGERVPVESRPDSPSKNSGGRRKEKSEKIEFTGFGFEIIP